MDGQALIRLLQNQKESLLAWLMLKTPSARPALQDHPIHLPVLHLADAQRQPRRSSAHASILLLHSAKYQQPHGTIMEIKGK